MAFLRGQGLQGVPVAMKLSPGKFIYLDEHGAILVKARAMKIADGLIYYEGEGRLRRQGTFVAVDEAREVIAGLGAIVAMTLPPVYEAVN